MTTTAGQHRARASAPAPRLGWLERLGRAEARHARAIAVTWVVAVALAFAVALGALGGGSLFDRLSSGEPTVPGETQTGRQLLEARSTSGERVLMMLDGVDPASAAGAAAGRAGRAAG